MYPALLADLRTRTEAYELLVARSDAECGQALLLARGEIEMACPAAYDGALGGRLDNAAWGLQLDIATWHLRMAVERDPETGSPPAALTALRRMLDQRIERLAYAAATSTGLMGFEPFASLDPVPMPGAGPPCDWERDPCCG